MYPRRISFATLFVALMCFAMPGWCAAPYGLSSRAAVGPFLNDKMPPTRPGVGSGDYTVEDIFPNLTFEDPTYLTYEPGTNRLYVTGRQGKIHWFVNNPATTTKTLFLDLSLRTQGYEDCGLLGFAFHPDWRKPDSTNRGHIFVWYQYTTNRVFPPPGSDRPDAYRGTWMRLSRFHVADGSNVANPASEVVLINQYDRHMWHNGGNMFFGPDGFLYIPVGDEGGIADEFNQAQRLDGGLFSGVLRIDVNSDPTKSHPIRRQPRSPPSSPASYSANYYIPNDNPWLDPAGSILEEFWAVGLRSPHRMTFDAISGQIWVGDIGQNTREELNLIEKAGNYQWAYREGTFTGFFPQPSPLIGHDKPPVYDYGRDNGDTCVIGGYVYRGTHLPELYGKYIFGDNTSGRIWSLTYNGSNTPPTIVYLCNIPPGHDYTGLSSFGVDQNNDLYALQMGQSGKVYKLTRTGPITVTAPALLSQTGAFADTSSLAPISALIPYTVNSPLWSDAAFKNRWMAVPNNGAPYTTTEQIGFAPAGPWTFPSGTVFVKHFELATNDTNLNLRKRLETRLLVRDTNGGVYGLTYKWRADNSDADLLTDSLSEDIVITTPTGTRTQAWFYPSPQDCLRCHTPEAGHVLGPKTAQLNGDFAYPSSGITDNQLRALNNVALFNPALNETSITNYPKMVAVTDTGAPLETRVRSYLDANCAQCHRPNGVQSYWDARFDTPLASQNILNGPVFNNLGIQNAKVVAPGDLSHSLMYLRMNTNGANKMPPLGRNKVDNDAVSALAAWINSYAPGPLPPPWQHQDIGSVGIAGSATYMTSLGIITIAGSGSDVWGSNDELHFAYQNVNGNCEVIARVSSITDTDPWARAGVMIRASADAGAANAFMAVSTQNGVELQWRATAGGESSYVQGPYNTAPQWVRLTRTNSTFKGWYSTDGTNWSQLGTSVSIDMPPGVAAGLGVTAVNNGALNTSTFDSVRINSGTTLDSDADGLPDTYELANGFNSNDAADAGQDSDSDGMTNLQEYWAGTNPRNAASVLRITRISRLGSNLLLSFISATGKTYAIERATNLPAISWQFLTNVGPFTNASTTITNNGGAAMSNGFYRLRFTP